ncbi:MAG: hypothetical protein EPN25_00325 [Nitrospirae bacterium]|nr:MAG: hypothetical protein EPN25_00325 [Nitrospirota bacterium]
METSKIEKIGNSLYGIFSAIAMGLMTWLSASMAVSMGKALIMAVAACIVFAVLFWIVKMIVVGCNTKAAEAMGKTAAYKAVDSCFILVLPFAVMATVAAKVFDWNTGFAFASAAIMIAIGSCGTPFLQNGGGWLAGMLLPGLIASGVSIGYVLLLTKVGGGV